MEAIVQRHEEKKKGVSGNFGLPFGMPWAQKVWKPLVYKM